MLKHLFNKPHTMPDQSGPAQVVRLAKPVVVDQQHGVDLIRDTYQLLRLRVNPNTEIASILATLNGHCPAFYADDGQLYTVPTADCERQEALNITKLIRFIKEQVDEHLSIRYCTRNVFEAFEQSRHKKSTAEDSREGSTNVEEILHRAIDMNATDIHIHIKANVCKIKFRIYGQVLVDQIIGAEQGRKIITAIWQVYVGETYASESAVDGRVTRQIGGKKWLFRFSYGQSKENREETLAIRLRDMRDIPRLDQLGYHPSQLRDFIIALGNKGVILIIGAVNSGKSTTQTAIMAGLPTNQQILEISDQIEVELAHVVQLQLASQGTQENIERNLKKLIKLPTRHDVNFLAINEIRDVTTAQMLATMMMQGTQGITSIHGSGWGDAINRLLPGELGVSPKVLFSDSFFNMIVFQTLTGVLCDHCKLPHHHDVTKDAYYRSGFGSEVASQLRFINVNGCEQCRHSGVTGMTLIAEVIPINQSNRALLENPANSKPMLEWMRENHILNVHQHALSKIKMGMIDPDLSIAKIGRFNRFNLFEQWCQ